LSTALLLSQFATAKLTGATRCGNKQDERRRQRQMEFDI
jgi:hypothetical protein